MDGQVELIAGPRTDDPVGEGAAGRPQARGRGAEVLRVVLGLLLLTAAALKSHGLALDPLAEDSFLSSPRLQIATIQVEVLLGLWLLSGWMRRVAWVVAIGFFGVMALVSFSLVTEGQESCGCFGRLTVNPWVTLALDVTCVAALAVWRPVRTPETRPAAWLRGVLQTGFGAVAIMALIGVVFLLASDDPSRTLARLRGEFISAEPGVSQVGDGVAGEKRTFAVRLTNYGDRPVRLVGGTASCGCVATGSLPTTVPPGEFRMIKVEATFQGRAGRFQHNFILYTDDEKQPMVTARFVGRVIGSSSP